MPLIQRNKLIFSMKQKGNKISWGLVSSFPQGKKNRSFRNNYKYSGISWLPKKSKIRSCRLKRVMKDHYSPIQLNNRRYKRIFFLIDIDILYMILLRAFLRCWCKSCETLLLVDGATTLMENVWVQWLKIKTMFQEITRSRYFDETFFFININTFWGKICLRLVIFP